MRPWVGHLPRPRGGCRRPPVPRPPSRPSSRSFHIDAESDRAQYLEQIHKGLGDDPMLRVDPGSKTITTVVGRLPVSPLMDPCWIEATRRWKHVKPKGRESLRQGRFHLRMKYNPYAKALATPLRKCCASGVVVPRFFLQRLGLVSVPENDSVWWAPKDIPWEVPADRPAGQATAGQTIETVDAEAGPETPDQDVAGPHPVAHDDAAAEREDDISWLTDDQQEEKKSVPTAAPAPAEFWPGREADIDPEPDADFRHEAAPAKRPARARRLAEARAPLYDPSAYLVLRRDFLAPARKTHMPRIFLPNWAATAARAVWRDGMDELVLRMRRRAIVQELARLASKERFRPQARALDAHESMENLHDVQFRGAILWLPPVVPAGGGAAASAARAGGAAETGHAEGAREASGGAPQADAGRRAGEAGGAGWAREASGGAAGGTGDAEASPPTAAPPPPPESPGESAAEPIPGPFSTMDLSGRKEPVPMAVHNLEYLLGADDLAQLRIQAPIFGRCRYFTTSSTEGLKVNMWMWQLQGYLLPAWPKLEEGEGEEKEEKGETGKPGPYRS